MAKHPPRQPISGVFSTMTVNVIGTGTTTRKTEAVTYHYVREREDGIIEVQPLGENVSFGPVREVTLDEFLEQFMPEPQMSQERARSEATRQGAAIKAVARGDKFYKRGKTYSAEMEYDKALAIDEDNVRANFGVGLCYIARNDQDKAREVFQRLLRLEAAFEPEHKHLFNEFGIQLRVSGMYAEALAYYCRALELSPDDENLLYNMARAAHGLGDMQAALEHLQQCLALNPDHGECQHFVNFLKRKIRGEGE